MDSRLIGCEKILEIRTSAVDLIIKVGKKQKAIIVNEKEVSSLTIKSYGLEMVKIKNQPMNLSSAGVEKVGVEVLKPSPLFFEQTDYEVIISSRKNEKIEFWHESNLIRRQIRPVIEDNETLLTGVINFENSVGYTELKISANGREILTVRIEVFPSKISYKEDYQLMIKDISEMVYGAIIDFMQKTYQEFSKSDHRADIPAIYFGIISTIFEKYIGAVNRVISVPHHRLVTEYKVVPEHKA